jgi:prepilin-type N-terminal cleavage/methylation domain-containing protein
MDAGNRRAFTLIELLVVIAIIVLLLSLLVPSLKQAKESARRTVCLNNLHGLAIATQLYAHDRNGDIPPAVPHSNISSSNPWNPRGCSNPFEAYVAWWYPNYKTMAWGAGILYEQRLIGEGSMAYCPSGAEGSRSRAFYPSPWGTQLSGQAYTRTMCLYFPYAGKASDDPAVRPYKINDCKLTTAAATCDFLSGPGPHGYYWTLAFVGGNTASRQGEGIVSDIDMSTLDQGWLGKTWSMFALVRHRLTGGD